MSMMVSQLEENSMRVIADSMLPEEAMNTQTFELMHRRQQNMNMLVKDVLALNPSKSSRMSQISVKERPASVYMH